MRHPLTAVIALVLAAPLAGALLEGCNLQRLVASSSGSVFGRAEASLQQHWDVELVGDGLPSSILTLEGIFSVVPDDQAIGTALVRAYVGYANGWIEDEAEVAEAEGDLDRNTELRVRARLIHLRARNIAIHMLRLRNGGIDDALRLEPDALRAYLESHYTSRDDAELLLFAGLAWGSAIGVAYDDPSMVLDLPTARTLVERAVALDESCFHYAGPMFLAALDSSVSETFGGDPARGRELFERALAQTDRRFFQIQLTYARTYAVNAGDRDLFIDLLREIIDGGDPDPTVRLSNRLARRRAIRWLRRVDDLF